MKTAIVLALLFAAAMARPQEDVQVVSNTNENDGSGNFKTGYSLSDGTNREETGEFTPIDAETGIQKITGAISWTAPDGQVITLRYVADEKGYQPVGDHLPKAQ